MGIRLLFLGLILMAVLTILLMSKAPEVGLPPVKVLQKRMGFAAEKVSVYEPHLSTNNQQIMVEYVGYRAKEVMAKLFGEDWQNQGRTVEFRALDGYIARIAIEDFLQNEAWLVFARGDNAPFTVDNIQQNQINVPLGPYYLVWDNVSNPALLTEGSMNWPYQIKEMNLITLSDAALLPIGLDPRFHEGARLVREHCLNCHKVNGVGGDKFTADLSTFVKGYSRKAFLHVVLTPASERPGATMPAISNHLSESERRRIAEEIFNYLKAVPLQP